MSEKHDTDIARHLANLRAQMQKAGIDACVIPQTDPHQSEYLADHWQVRRWLSGFTGSAGELVVLPQKALLWTDSRYFLQAAQQLQGSDIELMREGTDGVPTVTEWLCANIAKGQTVAIDGMICNAERADDMRHALQARGIKVDDSFDPAAADVWPGRPSLPADKIFIHDQKYAGESASSKITRLLQGAKAELADAVFISALDEIAWTLNLRSTDVRHTPVVTSFLLLAQGNKSVFFVDPAKMTAQVAAYLEQQGVSVVPYADVKQYLANLPEDLRVLVEPARNAAAIVAALGQRAVAGPSVAAVPKAVKNAEQLKGVRQAMLRDGVALVRAFIEIERRANGDGEPLTELDVCEILRRERSKQPLYFDESFGTIAGYGAHGAIVHYEPTAQSNAAIRTGNLLLIDSGAQYLDGTTDITRTISIGKPTPEQKRDFTLVMQGHIALGTAIYPAGTRGGQLDALAREPLWRNCLSYLHGTGHGVGQFLSVHEGPHSIRLNDVPTPLMPGMITSNEPGLYRENLYGIRCENLVLTKEYKLSPEFGQFLCFETLTLFPFDRSLFDTSMMTADQIRWVDDYHRRVRDALKPLLATDDERAWLDAKTLPLMN